MYICYNGKVIEIIKESEEIMNYYIADTHFGHENVIKFDNRPFTDVKEMNQALIDNWNEVVGKNDVVYVLGDFVWKATDNQWEEIFKLNGRKRLIKGNHDKTHNQYYKRFFESIKNYEEVKDGDHTVILSHYPLLAYNGSYKGRNVHLYGHVHTTIENDLIERLKGYRSPETPLRIHNVGAMMPHMEYQPKTLTQILERNNRD